MIFISKFYRYKLTDIFIEELVENVANYFLFFQLINKDKHFIF